MKCKIIAVCLFVASTLLLTGCWDRVEMEQRRFILGIGIDSVKPGQAAQKGEQGYMELTTGRPQYRLTYGVPKAAAAAGKSSGEGAGSKENELDLFTAESSSIFETVRIMLSRNDKKFYFEHMKVLAISEEQAKLGILDALDFFVRDPEMRRRVRVVVSQAPAEKFLSAKPPGGDYIPIMISNMLRGVGISRVNPEADLGNTIEKLHRGEDIDLPYFILEEGGILRIYGSAIFKKDKMVGTVGEIESRGINWMRGTLKGGLVAVELPGEGADTAVIELMKTDSKRKVEVDDQGNIVMVVNVKVKGTVGENQVKGADTLSREYFRALEDAVAKQIEREIVQAHLTLTQMDADVTGLGRFIYQENPKLWKQVGPQWAQVYPTVKIQAKAEAQVLRVGLTRN